MAQSQPGPQQPVAGGATTSADAARASLEREIGAGPDVIVSHFGGDGDWATGTLVIPAADDHGADEPQVFLYLARRGAAGWQAALEGGADFQALAGEAARALSGTAAGQLIGMVSLNSAAGSAELSLPWRRGEAWRLTGGPHNFNGSSHRTWSSLDLAGPTPGASADVHAARGGIVLRPCDNLVQVRHADGWTTSYYHLARIGVKAGEVVARGQYLGRTSTRAGCGGYATGPHVHFSLLRNGSYVNIAGHTIGGWTVTEGESTYTGCMVRDDQQSCAPRGAITNDGAIGAQPKRIKSLVSYLRGPRLD